MCENYDCDYPFGHDEVIYQRENCNIQSDEEVASIISTSKYTFGSPTATASVVSNATWLDIDKINKLNDNEGHNDQKAEIREYYQHKKVAKKEHELKKIEDNSKILKQVEDITKMHQELKKMNDSCIKNEKWIKNLMEMQKASGLSLLKPEELSMFKQKKPEIGLGELKIDIQNTSAIKIEIANIDPEDKGTTPKT